MLVPEEIRPDFVMLMDLNMLACTGGRERTQEEFGRLFEKAGFRPKTMESIPNVTSSMFALLRRDLEGGATIHPGPASPRRRRVRSLQTSLDADGVLAPAFAK